MVCKEHLHGGVFTNLTELSQTHAELCVFARTFRNMDRAKEAKGGLFTLLESLLTV